MSNILPAGEGDGKVAITPEKWKKDIEETWNAISNTIFCSRDNTISVYVFDSSEFAESVTLNLMILENILRNKSLE